MQPLHGLPQVRGSGPDCDDVAVVDIFPPAELDRGVVNSIQLESEQALRHLAREALGEVVDEEVNIHGKHLSFSNLCNGV